MKRYIVWYQEINDIPQECVGGDSWMEVDGRKTTTTIIRDINTMSQYKYRPKNAIGFKIAVGNSILESTIITNLMRI